MKQLKRGNRIVLEMISKNFYNVLSADGETIMNADRDYYIYFINVNFKDNGRIEGRYMGTTTDDIVDDHCKSVSYSQNEGFSINGKKIKTARMVAVNNKSKTIVVVSN